MKQSLIVWGAAAAALLGSYYIFKVLEPTQIALKHPEGKEPPAPPPPPQIFHITSPQVDVHPGRQYAAAINVSAPLSWLANASKVKAYAEGQGFKDVRITEDGKPQTVPSEMPRADYLVEATYVGPQPKSFSRSQGAGRVQIADAWQMKG